MPIVHLTEQLLFPPPEWATEEGLLAVGGDLSSARLLLAYNLGIFPWYGEGDPILWWSPDPRCVIEPREVHASRRLQRILKRREFRVTCNRSFAEVIDQCARVRVDEGGGTWLLPEMQDAYLALHRQGYAHSIEAWQDGLLVGGLYGLILGPFFFGESMFHRRSNASKVVLVTLAQYLAAQQFVLLDCQLPNPHLYRMGARDMDRAVFLDLLRQAGLGQAERIDFMPTALPEELG